jgi:hypothetical protein
VARSQEFCDLNQKRRISTGVEKLCKLSSANRLLENTAVVSAETSPQLDVNPINNSRTLSGNDDTSDVDAYTTPAKEFSLIEG